MLSQWRGKRSEKNPIAAPTLAMLLADLSGISKTQQTLISKGPFDMIDKTDDELADLGWLYVARDHLSNAVAVTSKDDTDYAAQVIEWLGEGYTVTQLFK
jgi:hypothetical protein